MDGWGALPFGCSNKDIGNLFFHAGSDPDKARGNPGVDINNVRVFPNYQVNTTITLAPKNFDRFE